MRRILEIFGIHPPRPKWQMDLDKAIAEFQHRHAEMTECLVCKAVEMGVKPTDLQLCWRYDVDKTVVWVEGKRK